MTFYQLIACLHFFIVHKHNLFVMLICHITVISLSICFCSDSPHSEPGTIDEADNGTEPHTSDEGLYIIVFYLNI